MSAVKCRCNWIFSEVTSVWCIVTLGSRLRFSPRYLSTLKSPGMLADKYFLFTAWHMKHSRSFRSTLECTLYALISALNWYRFLQLKILILSFLLIKIRPTLISTSKWLHVSPVWQPLWTNLQLQHVQQACQTGRPQAAFGLFEFLCWTGNLEEAGALYLV